MVANISAPLPPAATRIQFPEADLLPGTGLPALVQGQVLRVTVAARLETGVFLLQLGDTRIRARTTANLRPGQHLQLQVTATRPQMTLQIQQAPLDSHMAPAAPLLGRQAEFTAALRPLLQAAATDPRLSPAARQTAAHFLHILDTGEEPAQDAPQAATREAPSPGRAPAAATPENSPPLELARVAHQLHQQLRQLPSSQQAVLQSHGNVLHKLEPLLAHLASARQPLSPPDLGLLQSTLTLLGREQHNDFALTTLARQLLELLPLPKAARPPVAPSGPDGSPANHQPAVLAKKIKHFTQKLGTDFEHLLAQGKTREARQRLKGVLLEMATTGQTTGTAQPARAAADLIELFQLLQMKFQQQDICFYPLPMDGGDKGYLLIHDDSQHRQPEDTEETAHTYSLHLQLSGLGNLVIEIRQQGRQTSMRLYAQDRERARFLATFREELAAMLTTTRLESVQFLSGATPPDRTLLDQMRGNRNGLFNTTA